MQALAFTYWNARKINGKQTRVTRSELEELGWRTLALLLERFEDYIDTVHDENETCKFVADLNPRGETYGKFVVEACLYAASEVYGICNIEDLAADTVAARKSNMFYSMVLEVWDEVIGVRAAPPATSTEFEALKVQLVRDLHSLLTPYLQKAQKFPIAPVSSNGNTTLHYHQPPGLLGQVQKMNQYLLQLLQQGAVQEWDPADPLSLVNFIRVEDPHLRNDLHAIRTHLRNGFTDLVAEGKHVLLCETVYDVIQRHDWLYDFEPGFPDYTRQKIRTPREIHADRVGTCLDFACLFAAMLENMQANPVIVRLVDYDAAHALAGCWWRNRPMEPLVRDWQPGQNAVFWGDLVLFETTGAARSTQSVAGERRPKTGLLTWAEAQEAARALVLGNTMAFDFLLDVLAAR